MYDRERHHNQPIIQTYMHSEHCQKHNGMQREDGLNSEGKLVTVGISNRASADCTEVVGHDQPACGIQYKQHCSELSGTC